MGREGERQTRGQADKLWNQAPHILQSSLSALLSRANLTVHVVLIKHINSKLATITKPWAHGHSPQWTLVP